MPSDAVCSLAWSHPRALGRGRCPALRCPPAAALSLLSPCRACSLRAVAGTFPPVPHPVSVAEDGRPRERSPCPLLYLLHLANLMAGGMRSISNMASFAGSGQSTQEAFLHTPPQPAAPIPPPTGIPRCGHSAGHGVGWGWLIDATGRGPPQALWYHRRGPAPGTAVSLAGGGHGCGWARGAGCADPMGSSPARCPAQLCTCADADPVRSCA